MKVLTRTSVVDDRGTGMSIAVREHLAARPNFRTGAGPDSPWLSPSTLVGRRLHPNTVMDPAP